MKFLLRFSGAAVFAVAISVSGAHQALAAKSGVGIGSGGTLLEYDGWSPSMAFLDGVRAVLRNIPVSF